MLKEPMGFFCEMGQKKNPLSWNSPPNISSQNKRIFTLKKHSKGTFLQSHANVLPIKYMMSIKLNSKPLLKFFFFKHDL
jgi:hypothetical protein